MMEEYISEIEGIDDILEHKESLILTPEAMELRFKS